MWVVGFGTFEMTFLTPHFFLSFVGNKVKLNETFEFMDWE